MKTLSWIILSIVALVLVLAVYTPQTGTMSIIGNPQVTYTADYTLLGDEDYVAPPPLKIGSDVIGTPPVSFNCKLDHTDQTFDAPAPQASCWTDLVSYNGKLFNLTYGQPTPLNSFFNIQFITTSEMRAPDLKHQTYWLRQRVTDFKLDLYNKDFIQAILPVQDTLVALNDPKTVKVSIRNDLANNLEGGLALSLSNSLDGTSSITTVPMIFQKGTNEYAIPLNTSKLGKIKLIVRPFVTVMGVDYNDDRETSLTFNIVPTIEQGSFSVDCTETPCGTGFRCEHITYSNNDYNICVKGKEQTGFVFNEWALDQVNLELVAVIFAVVAVVIYFKKRK